MAIEHWNESVLDLIPGYRKTKRVLELAREHTTEKGDREVLGGMISDIDYALEWMQHGGRPYRHRGIERPYSTTTSNVTEIRSWDPKWLEVYRSPSGWSGHQEAASEESRDQQWRIDEALHSLSKRERECYVLHHGFGMDQRQVARELNLSRTAVQTYLERAELKIENEKLNNMFLTSW